MLTEKQIESAAIEMCKYNAANCGLVNSALQRSLISDEQRDELYFKLECNTMEVFGKMCAIMHNGGNEHPGPNVKAIRVDSNNIEDVIKNLRKMIGDDDNGGRR